MPSVLSARGEQRIDEADALAAEIRPIALGFQAKHPLTGLPTIADLAADEAPGPLAATASEDYAKHTTKSKQLRLWPQPPLPPM